MSQHFHHIYKISFHFKENFIMVRVWRPTWGVISLFFDEIKGRCIEELITS